MVKMIPILALVLGCAVPEVVVATSSTKTSVCHIVATPDQFVGKTIEAKAWIEYDGLETMLLIDSNCIKRGGILFLGAGDSGQRSHVRPAMNMVYDANSRSTPDKQLRVFATIVGTVRLLDGKVALDPVNIFDARIERSPALAKPLPR